MEHKKFSLEQSQSRFSDRIAHGILFLVSTISILATIGILVALIIPSIDFFRSIPIGDFLTGTEWSPLFADPKFGVLPLIAGTLMTTIISLSIALPLGLGGAIYLSEFATKKSRRKLKPILEILAGIPTVVYGFFALQFLTPYILKPIFPNIELHNVLSAGIIMGVMIVPTVTSLSEDAMSAVPHSLREGAYALGSHKRQVALKVIVPAAISGIIASFVLGISRAIGETMIVTIAAGLKPELGINPLVGMQTMTSFIAAAGAGDQPTGSIGYKTIFAVGLLLFIMTLFMNLISISLVRRFREVYE